MMKQAKLNTWIKKRKGAEDIEGSVQTAKKTKSSDEKNGEHKKEEKKHNSAKGIGGRYSMKDQKDEDYLCFSPTQRSNRFFCWMQRAGPSRNWPAKYKDSADAKKMAEFKRIIENYDTLPNDLTKRDKYILERLCCEKGEREQKCIIYKGACPVVYGIKRKDQVQFKIPFARLAYLLQADKPFIPKGFCVYRKCGNSRCVKKEHLYLQYWTKRAQAFKFYIDHIRLDQEVKEVERERLAKLYEEKLNLLLQNGYPEGDKGTTKETYAICEKTVFGFQLCSRCLNYKEKSDFEHQNRHGIAKCFTCREYLAPVANLSNPGNVKRRKLVEFYISLKKGQKCIDCGNAEYKVLEFDHRNPKEKLKQVKEMTTIETMKSEAAKCDLRCVNCHQIKTIKDGRERREGKIESFSTNSDRYRAKEFVNSIRMRLGRCEICQYFNKDFLEVLQFDHLDPTTKHNSISQMVNERYPNSVIQQEIDKCRMICGNCHRLHTIQQFNYMSYPWMKGKY